MSQEVVLGKLRDGLYRVQHFSIVINFNFGSLLSPPLVYFPYFSFDLAGFDQVLLPLNPMPSSNTFSTFLQVFLELSKEGEPLIHVNKAKEE